MAETDPVEIVVEIINKTKDDLARIRKDLEELGIKDINVDLDIKDNGELALTQAKLEAMDAQTISPELQVRRAVGDLTGGTIAELSDEWLGGIPRDVNMAPGGPIPSGAPSGFGADIPGVDMRDTPIRRLQRHVSDNVTSFRRLGQTLMKYRPTIMDWWNVVGLLIPIMISLAGATIGLAAAFGALATGGIAILGLGLLGWGEDMQSTMQNLQTEAMNLAKTLFGVFQPVGDVMQPIVEQWLYGAANELRRLVGPLEGMTVFADGLAAAGSGAVGWLAEVLTVMADMNEMAEQVALRFGGAIGEFLIDALSAMLREVYRNQDAYINMAELLLDVIVIIFNVSKAITMLISQFEPLFRLVAAFTDFAANKWVVVFGTVITTLLAMEAAATLLSAAYVKLALAQSLTARGIFATLLPSLTAAISTLWSYVTAVNAAIASTLGLSTLTAGVITGGLGLAAIGAAGYMGMRAADSMSPPSGSGGSRQVGGTTVINVQGDMREREVDRIVDQMGPESRNEMNIEDRRSPR